jgi:hypothetical protein
MPTQKTWDHEDRGFEAAPLLVPKYIRRSPYINNLELDRMDVFAFCSS